MFQSFITMSRSNIKTKYTSSNQLYHPLKKLREIDILVMEGLCGSSKVYDSCKAFFSALPSVASFDLFWDAEHPMMVLTAAWPLETRRLRERPYNDCTSQVAVLYQPDDVPGISRYQVSLDGHVHDFSPGSQPEVQGFVPGLRHRKHHGKFSAELLKPTGLHPVLQLHVKTQKPPLGLDDCKMHAYLTLPKNVFVDRYQLQDKIFLESKKLAALEFASSPVDLEAPGYAVSVWGSTVLVELAPPFDPFQELAWKTQIPLHLRYMEPNAGGYTKFDLPYPIVFWTCEVPVLEHIGRVDSREYLPPHKLPNQDRMLANAWDVTDIGYDALFSSNTSFWHLRPAPKAGLSLFHSVVVPAANSDHVAWIGIGTAFAVALGTSWVIWSLSKVWLANGRQPAKITELLEADNGYLGVVAMEPTQDGTSCTTTEILQTTVQNLLCSTSPKIEIEDPAKRRNKGRKKTGAL